ncbi:MAG: hypothetical protein ACLFTH_03435 [Candidatus Woesearchaeota archaeon]
MVPLTRSTTSLTRLLNNQGAPPESLEFYDVCELHYNLFSESDKAYANKFCNEMKGSDIDNIIEKYTDLKSSIEGNEFYRSIVPQTTCKIVLYEMIKFSENEELQETICTKSMMAYINNKYFQKKNV